MSCQVPKWQAPTGSTSAPFGKTLLSQIRVETAFSDQVPTAQTTAPCLIFWPLRSMSTGCGVPSRRAGPPVLALQREGAAAGHAPKL